MRIVTHTAATDKSKYLPYKRGFDIHATKVYRSIHQYVWIYSLLRGLK